MNIPIEVIRDAANISDGENVVASYEVIAEWARKEAEAERDALREARRSERRALVHRLNDYRDDLRAVTAENEALRAQLDNMTTEWSAPDTASIELFPFPFGYGTDEEMARRSAGALHGPVYKRLVGPWVEVTD